MIPSPEDVLELAQRIVELRAQLEEAEAEWKKLFDTRQMNMPIPITDSNAGESLRARIISHLETYPSTPFDAETLARLFSAHLDTVRTTLSKLVRAARIEKRGTSLYGAITAPTWTGENMHLLKEDEASEEAS